MAKVLYKRRQKEDFFINSNNDINVEEKFAKIKNIINSYIKENNEISIENYIEIYNTLFIIKTQEKYIELYKFINNLIKEELNKKLNSQNYNTIELIEEMITYINELELKLNNLESILITNKSRLNIDLIESQYTYFNINNIIDITNEKFNKFIEGSTSLLIKNFNTKNDLGIIAKYVDKLKKIKQKYFYQNFIENLFQKGLNRDQYEKIYNEHFNNLNKDTLTADLLINYVNNINETLEKDCIKIKYVFGENESMKFSNKIQIIYIFEKCLNKILKNSEILEKMISNKNLELLKLLEIKTRFNPKLKTEFINSFFDLLLNQYDKEIIIPKDKKNLITNLEYIQTLLDKITEINYLENEIFGFANKSRIKFKESLIKLIHQKSIPLTQYLISVYVNENLYNNEKIKNKYIYNKCIIQLLENLNNSEIFFDYTKKFIIKRISSHKFILEEEKKLEEFLRSNFPNKFTIPIQNIFRDINENRELNNIENNNVNFYLFCYNSVEKDINFSQLIEDKEYNLFLTPMKLYNEKYPKRNILISQMNSTVHLEFLKKYNIIVNYIQYFILSKILASENKTIKLNELMKQIPHNLINRIYIKEYLKALIEFKIISKNDEECYSINLGYKGINYLNCYESANVKVRKLLKEANNFNLKDDSPLEKSSKKEGNQVIIKENIKFILDGIIMKILKNKNDSNKKISEKDLILLISRNIIVKKYSYISESFLDVSFIRQRLQSLVERNLIKIQSEGRDLYYSYF